MTNRPIVLALESQNQNNAVSDSGTGVTGLSSGVVAISAGPLDVCVVTSSGGIKCWGDNMYGALGDLVGDHPSSTPLDVVGL